MTNRELALEALETNPTPKTAVQIIDELSNLLKPVFTTKEYFILHDAITELAEIKKRAEEVRVRYAERQFGIGYANVAKDIDFIIKGEPK